jgi:hypothetical protein
VVQNRKIHPLLFIVLKTSALVLRLVVKRRVNIGRTTREKETVAGGQQLVLLFLAELVSDNYGDCPVGLDCLLVGRNVLCIV